MGYPPMEEEIRSPESEAELAKARQQGVWIYPLVKADITMENHNFQWVNHWFLWPCSIAILNYQRVNGKKERFYSHLSVFFGLYVGMYPEKRPVLRQNHIYKSGRCRLLSGVHDQMMHLVWTGIYGPESVWTNIIFVYVWIKGIKR